MKGVKIVKSETYKKKWWKRVAPLMCALVVMFVSVVPVNASALGGVQVEQGSFLEGAMSFTWSDVDYVGAFQLEVVKSSAPIYVFFYSYSSSSNNLGRGACLVSEKSFSTKSYYSEFRNGNDIVFDILQDRNSASTSYNGKTYYFDTLSSLGGNPAAFEFHEFSIPYVNIDEYGQLFNGLQWGQIFEKFYNADLIFQGGSSSFEYSSSPSTQIDPPNGIRFNRSYSNEKKQYFCSLGWNKPTDEELRVEIMFNIHWKDGILGFGDHIYRKYNFVTYADEISAQQNVFSYYEDDFLKAYFEEQEMDLPSAYNIDELYVRFSKEVDGKIEYSLWQKINYSNLDEGNGYDDGEDDYTASNKTGYFDSNDEWKDTTLEDDEFKDGSETENSKSPGYDVNGELLPPAEKDPLNPDTWDEDVTDVFKNFGSALSSAMDFVGDFPSMISEFFSFLPSPIIGCIGIGLLMLVLLRFLGR